MVWSVNCYLVKSFELLYESPGDYKWIHGVTDALSRKQSVCVIAHEYKHQNILISLHPGNCETLPCVCYFYSGSLHCTGWMSVTIAYSETLCCQLCLYTVYVCDKYARCNKDHQDVVSDLMRAHCKD